MLSIICNWLDQNLVALKIFSILSFCVYNIWVQFRYVQVCSHLKVWVREDLFARSLICLWKFTCSFLSYAPLHRLAQKWHLAMIRKIKLECKRGQIGHKAVLFCNPVSKVTAHHFDILYLAKASH